MHAIMLDAQQTSVLAHSYESIPVRDHAGTLLGYIMPTRATSGQEGNAIRNGPSNIQQDKDRWIRCWNEWYFQTDKEEPELPETD